MVVREYIRIKDKDDISESRIINTKLDGSGDNNIFF